VPAENRSFTITPTGAFSLDQAASFGFGPREAEAGGAMRLAFAADGSGAPTGVVVRESPDGTITGEVHGTTSAEDARAQVARILSLEHDGTAWQEAGGRDEVLGDLQSRFSGLRPVLFHSPYEAAAWSVLSQRIRIVQAARLRADLVDRHGDRGAFPAPQALRGLDLDLPGRKAEYLHAVAEAALDGRLDTAVLRSVDPDDAVRSVQEVKGLGPFAAELVVLRGANVPDALPRNERRLDAEVAERYGADRRLDEVAEAWRPFRTWAAVHLRALREHRTGEIGMLTSSK
jgi:DNA-3-methyladenine glycosylase II